jgi:hypothetical protein
MAELINFLTIVVDSCRYDTYRMANTTNLDKVFDVVEGSSQATFTLPAHAAMLQGFYPSTKDDRLLYNRMTVAPFQWHYINRRKCLMDVPKTGHTIPEALSGVGYRTVCVGGVGWFKELSPLRCGFQHFGYRSNANKAIEEFTAEANSEPFYGLLNFGATHRPYNCPDMPGRLKDKTGPRLSSVGCDSKYDYLLHSKQAYCMGWLDKQIASLLEWLSKLSLTTVVCFCADHGDCFGEDGCYGHAFYHKNVMSVPLAWSMFKDGVGQPIDEDLFRASD